MAQGDLNIKLDVNITKWSTHFYVPKQRLCLLNVQFMGHYSEPLKCLQNASENVAAAYIC